MAGFCSAVSDWTDAITRRQASFNTDTTDLATLKQGWLDFLDGVSEDSDAMLAKLQDLGSPDVPNGQQMASSLSDALTSLVASFKDLRDKSADLPTTSPTAFTQQFQALLTKFQSDASSFGDSFDQLQSSELESAFSAAPACAPLK